MRNVLAQIPTNRCHTLAGLEAHGRYVLAHLDELLDFHQYKGFRDLRFRRYGAQQKTFHELAQRFLEAGGDKPLIGFGDYGATGSSSVIKGHVRAPIKKLRTALMRYGLSVPYVDEAYTSQRCSLCHEKMVNQRRRSGSQRLSKVYSVLHCVNNVCLNTTVHRDIDAAASIRDVLLYQMRWGVRHPGYTLAHA